MLSETAIEVIAHTGMAFEAAQIDTVVIAVRTVSQPKNTTQTLHAFQDFRGVTSAKPDLVLPQSLFWKLEGLKFNIHLDSAKQALVEKLSSLPKLRASFHAHEGIHSGNVREKLFLDKAKSHHCRKLIFGRDEIARYRITWGGRWVNYHLSSIDREAGEYANLGHPEYFDPPKLLVRRTGDFVMAAIDRDGFYASNNLFVVLPCTQTAGLKLETMVGILNSRLITWFFRAIQPRVGKLFAELKINQLHQFPLLPDDRRNEANRLLVALVDQILAAKRTSPDADTSALEAEVDRHVYALYDLTPEEIALVEGKAKPE